MIEDTSVAMESTSNSVGEEQPKKEKGGKTKGKGQSGPPFTLKKWNAVAMWQWDVECDTCAICRVQVMGKITNDILCVCGSSGVLVCLYYCVCW